MITDTKHHDLHVQFQAAQLECTQATKAMDDYIKSSVRNPQIEKSLMERVDITMKKAQAIWAKLSEFQIDK